MLTAKHVAIFLGVILALFLGVMGKIAYDDHQALANATTVSATNQATIQTLMEQIANRDKADTAQQKQATVAESNVKTSADAVQVITKYVQIPAPTSPTAPAPVQVVSKQDLTPQEQAKLPDSPDFTIETQDVATGVAKQLISCAADKQSLDACHADLADSSTALTAQQASTATWEAAAKGGTKAQRFVKFLKCAAAGGGGAALVVAAGQSKWAGIGAVAGVTACQFF